MHALTAPVAVAPMPHTGWMNISPALQNRTQKGEPTMGAIILLVLFLGVMLGGDTAGEVIRHGLTALAVIIGVIIEGITSVLGAG